jgi:hypothetical protein
MWYNARLGVTLALLSFTFATNIANAQDASATAGASPASSTLSPVDYQFVAEANLGAPFQVDSGRLGENVPKPQRSATTPISWWSRTSRSSTH